jgi:hypothetical protein
MILDMTKAPTYAKVLPFVGIGVGLALAKYQKKTCMWCYVGYGLTGLVVGSVPLLVQSKS